MPRNSSHGPGSLSMQSGVALVLGWCAARESDCIERLPGPWEEFRGTKAFWK